MRFVKNRTVDPDDVFDVVFDFCRIIAVGDDFVRSEMAVRHGMAMTVLPRSCFVEVLRRQRRRERQKRRSDGQGDSASPRANHSQHYSWGARPGQTTSGHYAVRDRSVTTS
jgi:hypothetical protein